MKLLLALWMLFSSLYASEDVFEKFENYEKKMNILKRAKSIIRNEIMYKLLKTLKKLPSLAIIKLYTI